MTRPTTIDGMRFAIQQYRIDQPDSYTFAIYGPDEFYELHDSFSAAFERREELGLLAAMKAASLPSNAIINVDEITLKGETVEQVWQALVRVIVTEYETSHELKEAALAS